MKKPAQGPTRCVLAWLAGWGLAVAAAPALAAIPHLTSDIPTGLGSIAAGSGHSCAITKAGGVKCWGNNGKGQLGNGSFNYSKLPVPVSGITGVIAIAAGSQHTCAVLDDGTVRCWGWNHSGQLGNGNSDNSNLPLPVDGVEGAVAIAAGEDHTCALLADGTARCWGTNGFGQLGNGNFDDGGNVPNMVDGLIDAVAITAGAFYTCVLLTNGTARCWGANYFGQLGDGTFSYGSNVPIPVRSLDGVSAIAAGDAHTCAVLNDGSVRCWGSNSESELGDGSTDDSNVPIPVSNLVGAVAITGGGSHTCALLDDGTARCWGRNRDGQLGDASTDDSNVPVPVNGLTQAVTIEAGSVHTCAVSHGGSIQCWGSNHFGQLGNDSFPTVIATIPAEVVGINDGVTISAGFYHTCAVLDAGTARCWGVGDFGQLGTDNLSTGFVPAPVIGLVGTTAISAGLFHTCAVLDDGTVHCWGWNGGGRGLLGNGSSYENSSVPVPVSGLDTAVAVAAGAYHTCALLDDGTALCWGGNDNGQLGNSSVTYSSSVPVPVNDLAGATAITAGDGHTCVLLDEGTVRCWGGNSAGQLGDGSTENSTLPVAVSGLVGAIAIAAGVGHTCALIDDGTARCWGANYHGQLGDGGTDNSSIPVPVSGLAGAIAIDAAFGTCAVLRDGKVFCWGDNSSGQLGDGGTEDSNVPVLVRDLPGAVAVATGDSHACAVLRDGTARCWGSNGDGQFGNGIPWSTVPIPVTGSPFCERLYQGHCAMRHQPPASGARQHDVEVHRAVLGHRHR